MRTKLVGQLERTPELTKKFHSLCHIKYGLVDGLGMIQLAGSGMLDYLAGQTRGDKMIHL